MGCPRSQVWEVAVLGLEDSTSSTQAPECPHGPLLPSIQTPTWFSGPLLLPKLILSPASCLETRGSYFSMSRTLILRRLIGGPGGAWG